MENASRDHKHGHLPTEPNQSQAPIATGFYPSKRKLVEIANASHTLKRGPKMELIVLLLALARMTLTQGYFSSTRMLAFDLSRSETRNTQLVKKSKYTI